MSKEKETVSVVTAETAQGATEVSKSANVKPVVLSMAEALRKAVRERKSYKLVRKVFKGKNGRYYYSYSIIIMLKSALKVKEIRVVPDVGYVRHDDAIRSSQSNSASYSMLNIMYDLGNGANLVIREDNTVDRNGIERTSFNFYAVSDDPSGLQQEYLMTPATVGEKSMLYSAFTGFGGVRDWTEDDKSSVPELVDLLVNYCAPGMVPEVTIENA